MLPILFKNDQFVAIHKPPGLLVHKSLIDKNETQYAMKILRDQIGKHVYPVHRLDKPTSGVLMFALNRESAKSLSEQFSTQTIQKKYLAVVRGFIRDQTIDYPLYEELDKMTDSKSNKNKQAQNAISKIRSIAQIELPYATGKYKTSRYSLVEVIPLTGRKHQIRRHLKHIHHPIIGDTTYGKSEHNNLFKSYFNVSRLLLACYEMSFYDSFHQKNITVTAPIPKEYTIIFNDFEWKKYYVI